MLGSKCSHANLWWWHYLHNISVLACRLYLLAESTTLPQPHRAVLSLVLIQIRVNPHFVSLHAFSVTFTRHGPVHQSTLSWNVKKSFNLLNQILLCLSVPSALGLQFTFTHHLFSTWQAKYCRLNDMFSIQTLEVVMTLLLGDWKLMSPCSVSDFVVSAFHYYTRNKGREDKKWF